MNPRRLSNWAVLALVVLLAPSYSGALPQDAAGEGHPIYGVFVGISDYPGTDHDLAFTADDSHRVNDALIRAGMSSKDAIVLTNADATVDGLRGAFEQISQRVGPSGTFVFFYSGHGGRKPHSDAEPADSKATDVTIELYDGPVDGEQLNAMLADVNAGAALVVIDAAFSGGFAGDVISVAGRMGIFSSEEDAPSYVASEFRAGGYLSVFLAEAVGDGLADNDEDGNISALELSQYMHERYREAVGADQRLVIDRGSVGPHDVLFRLPR